MSVFLWVPTGCVGYLKLQETRCGAEPGYNYRRRLHRGRAFRRPLDDGLATTHKTHAQHCSSTSAAEHVRIAERSTRKHAPPGSDYYAYVSRRGTYGRCGLPRRTRFVHTSPTPLVMMAETSSSRGARHAKGKRAHTAATTTSFTPSAASAPPGCSKRPCQPQPGTFVSSDYDHGHTGIEVLEGGLRGGPGEGTAALWRQATVYTHLATGNLVLWFGGDDYEGIGGSYCWSRGGAGCRAGDGQPRGPRLLDSDGDSIVTRARTPPCVSGDGVPVPAHAACPERPAKRTRIHTPFAEALVFARRLHLRSQAEWRAWCRTGARPARITKGPGRVYAGSGWQGYGHWLGNGTTPRPRPCAQPRGRQFLPFGEARAVAHSLGLASVSGWKALCRNGMRPATLPAGPDRVYKNGGWRGWGKWLGTNPTTCTGTTRVLPSGSPVPKAKTEAPRSGREAPVPSTGVGPVFASKPRRADQASGFLPFAEALVFARNLHLCNHVEWRAWCRTGARPTTIPTEPGRVYARMGWQGFGHWLGTGNKRRNTTPFLPFCEALAVARSLGLDSASEWKMWSKESTRPPNVPSQPSRTYKDGGWQGWSHWLGTGNHRCHR